MLSTEENEILCRVGPGTLMGNLLRRYWTPALLSVELPSNDCPPIRVRLLGEDLIAFRDTDGKVGLFANSCPHRGASMFFGRNEEGGLRCVYHGWKFDVEGTCVDMPSEPAESNFKSKVRIGAYPTYESGGIVWTYMGPKETMPAFRDLGTEAVAPEPGHAAQAVHLLQLDPGDGRQHRYVAHLVAAPVVRPRRFAGRRHRQARLPDEYEELVSVGEGPGAAPGGGRHVLRLQVRGHPHHA